MKPTVGRIVHYVSRGSADGFYDPQCRAAIVTDVGGSLCIDLCVVNPEGLFFNIGCNYSEAKSGGSWHWPERVED